MSAITLHRADPVKKCLVIITVMPMVVMPVLTVVMPIMVVIIIMIMTAAAN